MRRRALLAAAVLLTAGCLYPGAEAPDVRTAPLVVAEMLRMATVTSTDVVYDLGSGDGRLVIGAAQQFGARGVGVEIDPKLVAESRKNAERAKVQSRVRFVEGDLFQTDLREATVVTLYLGKELNMRLRPKLLSELKPGSRVVSHDFDMGDWKPDRVQKFLSPEREHVLYLWTIPPR
jgi:SAM-dependent methyltransferase